MKPVFLSLKEFDKSCDKKYKMQGEILMENAARGMCEKILYFLKKHFNKKSLKKIRTTNKARCSYKPLRPVIQIVCGSGDNGADGLALARMLYDFAEVRVVSLAQPKSPLCILQTERLKKLNITVHENLSQCDILVDAFLGTGIKGALREEAVQIINEMNALPAYKIACDIPSGLSLYGLPSPVALKVNLTLSAGALKLAFFSDIAKDYVGKIKNISLGLPSENYAPKNEASAFLLTEKNLQLPVRTEKNTHKGNFGHAAIYCGEKEGAAVLAGLACLKFGAGLVTLCGHKPTNLPPDLMHATEIKTDYSSYCIGPGLGENAENIVSDFLEKINKNITMCNEPFDKNSEKTYAKAFTSKIVFDADALRTLSLAKNLKYFTNCIITPHPREFCILIQNLAKLGELNPDLFVLSKGSEKLANLKNLNTEKIQNARFYFAKAFSENFPQIVLVLKGSNTIIAHREKLYICTKGRASLSKAGSGDVLAGLLTALLAQGYSCKKASFTATLAQGKISQMVSSYASTASELIEKLSKLEG